MTYSWFSDWLPVTTSHLFFDSLAKLDWLPPISRSHLDCPLTLPCSTLTFINATSNSPFSMQANHIGVKSFYIFSFWYREIVPSLQFASHGWPGWHYGWHSGMLACNVKTVSWLSHIFLAPMISQSCIKPHFHRPSLPFERVITV